MGGNAQPFKKALETATDTKEAVLGKGVIKEAGAIFSRVFPGKRAVVVADGNTFAAGGEQTIAALSAAGIDLEESIIFPGIPTLYAEYTKSSEIREKLRGLDAIAVVVGSGTLNDLVKLASGELARPYMVVCTAPSMDGYASFGASITKDGFKITRSCPAPAAIVADLEIMATAPLRLVATGVGDLIEKIPAGEDWIIADLLGIESRDPYIWSLVQGPLRSSFAEPERLQKREVDALEGLSAGLLMSGLAMQAASSSRPASGAGHQFSHLWEMEGHGLDWEPPLTHGFKVGLGTVAICALYEAALTHDVLSIDIEARVAAWPTREEMETRVRSLNEGAPSGLVEAAVKQTDGKYLTPHELHQRLQDIKDIWPHVVETSKEQLASPEEMRDILKTVEGIYHPSQIKIGMKRFRDTYERAQTIRTRYTILDVLYELGILDECIEELFAPGGYWGRNATA